MMKALNSWQGGWRGRGKSCSLPLLFFLESLGALVRSPGCVGSPLLISLSLFLLQYFPPLLLNSVFFCLPSHGSPFLPWGLICGVAAAMCCPRFPFALLACSLAVPICHLDKLFFLTVQLFRCRIYASCLKAKKRVLFSLLALLLCRCHVDNGIVFKVKSLLWFFFCPPAYIYPHVLYF